jgi:hypothetical protein
MILAAKHVFYGSVFVGFVGRGTFDAIHDFGQRINLHGLLVDERREDEVNVIRHHNSDKQVEFNSVVVKAALEHDRTDAFRKNPPVISTESDEMLPVIALKMRKLSTIKSLPHKV